jgi:hypothetical protein
MYIPDNKTFGPLDNYDFDAVNTSYVQTFLCPKDYAERRPLQVPVKTSLALATTQLTLTANANGDVGFYVLPVNATG